MRKMMTLAGLAASVVMAAAWAQADWPQTGGPNRNSVAPDAQVMSQWPAEGPTVLWSVPLGEGFGGAAIRDGEVYVLDRVKDAQDVLRCLDLKTGKELWTFVSDAPGKSGFNGSRSVPTVTEKYVFACGPFGQLMCIDRKTHQQVWQTNVIEAGAKMPPWAIAQSPLIYQDSVITSGLGSSGGVTAWDQATGKLLWRSADMPGTPYCSPSLIDILGKPQVVMVSSKGVSGLDPANGKVLWNFPGYKCSIPIPNVTPVGAPADGKLFVTGGYKAGSVMIQLQSEGEKIAAKELWRIPQGSQIHHPIAVEDRIYLNGTTNETPQDNFTCLDVADGKVLWQAKEIKLDRAGILLAGGMFFMIDSGGTLHTAKAGADKLEEAGAFKVLAPKDIWAPAAISDGILVIRDQKQMKALEVGKK